MHVGKCDKPSAWFQDAHHRIETLHLQRLRKYRPRQSGHNAVHRLHSGTFANALHVGNAVLKQPYKRITRFEHFSKVRIQFNGSELRSRPQFAQNELRENTGARTVFEHGVSRTKIKVLYDYSSKKARTRHNRAGRGRPGNKLPEEFHDEDSSLVNDR